MSVCIEIIEISKYLNNIFLKALEKGLSNTEGFMNKWSNYQDVKSFI